MTRFNPTQLADLTARAQRMLDLTRQAMRDQETPGRLGERLVTEMTEVLVGFGAPGIAFCIRAWADAVVTATPGAKIGHPVQIAFASPDHTRMVPARFIRPERKWASDIIAARFAADQAAIYRGISALPHNRDAMIYLYALVEMVAGVLNDYETPAPGPIKGGLYVQDATTGILHPVGEKTP